MTILAIVNASQEGQIESKMMKSRQLEEIREARRKEADVRQQQKEAKMVGRRASSTIVTCLYIVGAAKGLSSPKEETQR